MDYIEDKLEVEYALRDIDIDGERKTQIELTSGVYEGLRFHFNKFDPDLADERFDLDYSITLVPSRMSGNPKRYEFIVQVIMEDFINKILLSKKESE